MNCKVWWPHSIVNGSLSIIPFLEEISSVLLMCWMDFWEVDHLVHQFSLLKTLVNHEIVFLMHSSVTSLACSLPNLETSSERSRIVGIPRDLRRPMIVTMVHTNWVDLLLITLDTMWGTNIIPEQPSFCLLMTKESVFSCKDNMTVSDWCSKSTNLLSL